MLNPNKAKEKRLFIDSLHTFSLKGNNQIKINNDSFSKKAGTLSNLCSCSCHFQL